MRYFDENSAEFVDDLVKEWGRVVVPFFRPGRSQAVVARGFGSGFVARAHGMHWLVTALHVVKDAVRYDACVINLLGQAVVLRQTPFFPDEGGDLAVAPLEGILAENRFPCVPAVDLDSVNEGTAELGYHLLMGYPGSKNKLKPKWGKVDRRLLSITAERAPTALTVPTDIRDPVLFRYAPRAQVDSRFNPKRNGPELYGMSGGPAFELRATCPSANEFRFHLRLSGVLLEWRRDQSIVVGTSPARLRELLAKLIALAAR